MNLYEKKLKLKDLKIEKRIIEIDIAINSKKREILDNEVNIPMDMFFIFDYGYRQLRKKYSSDFEKLQKLEQEI